MTEPVLYVERDDIAIISINRPHKKNTLTDEVIQGIADGIDRATKSRDVCAIVLRGEGDTYVVVASRGGDDHHPAWFVNLRANSTVWVETQSESKHERRARIATTEERDEMWPIIVAKYANYGGYQLKTEREIPLIFLEKV